MELKPLVGRTNFLLILLKLNVVLLVIAIGAGMFEYYTSNNLPADYDSEVDVLPSEIVNRLTGLTQFVLAIVLGVTFLRWIFRINKNLNALSWEEMHYTPGWSVGWYFVPFANLFKPYYVMREIWDVSHRDEHDGHSLLGWWWGLWIVSNIIGQVASRLTMNAENLEQNQIATMVYLVSDTIDIPLSLVAIALVSRIAGAYELNLSEDIDAYNDEMAAQQNQV